ncbi:hypothetical protein [Streptomyces monashensis]|uniref:Uncharacterized protein n=1 Tax=Streptomyces monashensis TaxID=1678012 RepID=A0A1S2PIP9_9ACTN|nr:hypothetical protein [Streptomyces monashensis]OIJ93603.1 hypothetical protein BIV23_37260 [Streptomyces monashensis]
MTPELTEFIRSRVDQRVAVQHVSAELPALAFIREPAAERLRVTVEFAVSEFEAELARALCASPPTARARLTAEVRSGSVSLSVSAKLGDELPAVEALESVLSTFADSEATKPVEILPLSCAVSCAEPSSRVDEVFEAVGELVRRLPTSFDAGLFEASRPVEAAVRPLGAPVELVFEFDRDRHTSAASTDLLRAAVAACHSAGLLKVLREEYALVSGIQADLRLTPRGWGLNVTIPTDEKTRWAVVAQCELWLRSASPAEAAHSLRIARAARLGGLARATEESYGLMRWWLSVAARTPHESLQEYLDQISHVSLEHFVSLREEGQLS